MKSIAWLAGATLALATPFAFAQGDPRFYVGASAGSSDIGSGVTEGLITSGTVDGKDSGTKLYGGYRFSQHFALELAYVDLGKASYSGDFMGAPVTGGTVKVSGFNSSVVGIYPATPKLDLFAKAGLFAWEAKASDVTGGVPFSGRATGSNLSYGVGATYNFTKNVGARLEWEQFELDPGKASLLSAGVVVKF